MSRLYRRYSSGVTLLEVLIAAVLLGVVSYAIAMMFRSTSKATKNLELKDELIGLRRTFRERANCGNTLAGQKCEGKTYFPVRDASGKEGAVVGISQGNAWQLGDFQYRASCSATGGLLIEFRLVGAKFGMSEAVKLNTAHGTTAWNPVYANGELSCSGCAGVGLGHVVDVATNSKVARCDGSWMMVQGDLINTHVSCGLNTVPTESWSGFAVCPPGYYATGGGGSCVTTSGVGPDKGATTESYPTSSGDAWFLRCCDIFSAIPKLAQNVSVFCIKNP